MTDEATEVVFGTCSGDGCEMVTPWDMASIVINRQSFCSPSCARSRVSEMDDAPEHITLHDPQYHVSRDELGRDVDDDDIEIWREVQGLDDTLTAIDEIEEMFPGPFRPSREDND